MAIEEIIRILFFDFDIKNAAFFEKFSAEDTKICRLHWFSKGAVYSGLKIYTFLFFKALIYNKKAGVNSGFYCLFNAYKK